MKSSAFYAILGAGIIIIACVIWYGVSLHHPKLSTSAASSTTSSTTPEKSLAGLSIYTNGTYGFSIFYPESDTTETTFDSQYHLPATWRVNALPDATGTPILAIIGYSTKSDNSYPRYFETEVRIGASKDPKEVAACAVVGNGETALPDQVIGGTTWKAFTLQDAGMMQYLSGVSYRTVHDGTCYALEQIETGSSYRDDPPSAKDIPDTTLKEKYADVNSIVSSFSFAKP
jgi:hypothetical protein